MEERINVKVGADVGEFTRKMADAGRTMGDFNKSTQNMSKGLSDAAVKAGVYVDANGKLREANGRFVSSTRKAELGLEGFGRANTSVLGKIEANSAAIKRAGALVTGFGVAIAAGLGGMVKVAANFESSMSRVKAVSGATDEEFAQLTKTARHLGETTVFSASQASEGMNYLALAGWKTNEIIEGMPGMLNLAAAGSLDLARAADITSDTMSAFGLSADKATHAADVFAYAQSNANTSVEQMGEAMNYLAPTANSLGWTLEESSAVIMKLADSGLKGSMATQAFGSSLVRLSAPTPKAAKLIKKLGMEFFDAEGNMKTMPEVLAEMEKGLAGMSDQQKAATMDVLVGKNAFKQWQILLDAGSDSLGKLTKELENSDGTAAKMAETMLDNLGGAVVLLKSALEGVAITVGNALIPAIRKVTEWLTSLADWFNALPSSVQKGIVAFAAMGTAVSLVSGTLLILIGFLPQIIAGVKLLGTALSLISGPIGLAIAGITALTVGGIAFANHMRKDALPAVQHFGKGVSDATAEALGGFFDLSDGAAAQLSNMSLTAQTVTKDMSAQLVGNFDAMHKQIVDSMNASHDEQMQSMESYFAKSAVLTVEEEQKILDKRQSAHEKEVEILNAKNGIVQEIMAKAAEEKRALTEHESQVINEINQQMKEQAVKTLTDSEVEQKIILEKMKDNASIISAQQATDVVKQATEQRKGAVAEAEKLHKEALGHIIRMRDETGDISKEQADKLIREADRKRDKAIEAADEMRDEVVARAKEQADEHVK